MRVKDGWLCGLAPIKRIRGNQHQPRPSVMKGKWGGQTGPSTGARQPDHQETGARYRSSPSLQVFCLPQPGLQWVRSFFCYQSSFFGRHLGQFLRQPARYYSGDVQMYSGGIHSGQQIIQSALGESRLVGLILRQVGGCGGGGGTGGTSSHSATLLDTPSATLMATTLRNWWDFKSNILGSRQQRSPHTRMGAAPTGAAIIAKLRSLRLRLIVICKLGSVWLWVVPGGTL